MRTVVVYLPVDCVGDPFETVEVVIAGPSGGLNQPLTSR